MAQQAHAASPPERTASSLATSSIYTAAAAAAAAVPPAKSPGQPHTDYTYNFSDVDFNSKPLFIAVSYTATYFTNGNLSALLSKLAEAIHDSEGKLKPHQPIELVITDYPNAHTLMMIDQDLDYTEALTKAKSRADAWKNECVGKIADVTDFEKTELQAKGKKPAAYTLLGEEGKDYFFTFSRVLHEQYPEILAVLKKIVLTLTGLDSTDTLVRLFRPFLNEHNELQKIQLNTVTKHPLQSSLLHALTKHYGDFQHRRQPHMLNGVSALTCSMHHTIEETMYMLFWMLTNKAQLLYPEGADANNRPIFDYMRAILEEFHRNKNQPILGALIKELEESVRVVNERIRAKNDIAKSQNAKTLPQPLLQLDYNAQLKTINIGSKKNSPPSPTKRGAKAKQHPDTNNGYQAQNGIADPRNTNGHSEPVPIPGHQPPLPLPHPSSAPSAHPPMPSQPSQEVFRAGAATYPPRGPVPREPSSEYAGEDPYLLKLIAETARVTPGPVPDDATADKTVEYLTALARRRRRPAAAGANQLFFPPAGQPQTPAVPPSASTTASTKLPALPPPSTVSHGVVQAAADTAPLRRSSPGISGSISMPALPGPPGPALQNAQGISAQVFKPG